MQYKKGLIIVGLCISSLILLFFANNTFRTKSIAVSNEIRALYKSTLYAAQKSYERYIAQSKMIELYHNQVAELSKLRLENESLKSQLANVYSAYPNLARYENTNFEPALIIGYAQEYSFDSIWLKSAKKYQSGRIFGLVLDDIALGIAIAKDGYLLGLLNGNPKANYSVNIGESKVPAIAHSNPEQQDTILADYIPEYLSIKVGDEVVTSGLDGLFTQNIKVGKVIQVLDKNGYISAIVKPYKTKKSDWVFVVNRDDTDFLSSASNAQKKKNDSK